MTYRIQIIQEHVEVYDENGRFLFSADTQAEAQAELAALEVA
jgi:hypothetical protein